MVKGIRFKIRDLFTVPLENNLLGVGRVLKIHEDTVLAELFNIRPLKNYSDFNFEIASKGKAIISWCYNDALKNGNGLFLIINPL